MFFAVIAIGFKPVWQTSSFLSRPVFLLSVWQEDALPISASMRNCILSPVYVIVFELSALKNGLGRFLFLVFIAP